MSKRKNSFQRIRSDHRSEITEDYLEAIADIEATNGRCRGGDLANHFSVSHATVTETISRLKDAGLVEAEAYCPISLTSKGRRVARRSKERHEVVLSFLLSIGVPTEVAEVDAEGIEHHVSEQTLACFRRHVKRADS